MRDDREEYRKLRRRVRPVHPDVLEDLYAHAPDRGGARFLPALGLAVLTAIIVATAALVLIRAGDRPGDDGLTAAGDATPTMVKVGDPVPSIPRRDAVSEAATASRAGGVAGVPTATRKATSTAILPTISTAHPTGVLAFGMQGSLYVMNADGSNPTALLRDYDADRHPSGFAWSPDGSRIAYTDIEERHNEFGGYNTDILVINADGSGKTRLTGAAGGSQFGPAWSADGRYIAYSEVPPGENGGDRVNVYLINPDGTDRRLFIENAAQPSWSPDGERIAFAVPHRGIDVMNADGSGRVHLGTTDGYDRDPVWSPDGSRIAFVRGKGNPGNLGDIYVMDADGREAVRLTRSGNNSSPTWSPDGTRIAFARQGSGTSRIHTISVDGTDERAIPNDHAIALLGTPEEPDLASMSEPAWAPAGVTVAEFAGPTPAPEPTAPRSEQDTHYIKVNGTIYTSEIGSEARSALKEPYTTVKRNAGRESAEAGRLQDGDSTLHEPGTKLYRMKGYQPEYMLAADDPDKEGQILWYTAQPNRRLRTGADLFDTSEVYAVTGGLAYEHQDGGRGLILDPPEVAEMIRLVKEAPVRWDAAGDGESPPLQASFWLRDGHHNDFGISVWPERLQLPPEFWEKLREAARSGWKYELQANKGWVEVKP